MLLLLVNNSKVLMSEVCDGARARVGYVQPTAVIKTRQGWGEHSSSSSSSSRLVVVEKNLERVYFPHIVNESKKIN